MTKKKSKKEFKLKRIWIFLAAFIFVIIILSSYLGFRIKFLIQDELQVYLEPLHSNISIKNNEPISLDFSLNNKNFRTCKTKCNLTLTDSYTGEIISEKTLTLGNNQDLKEKYEFNLELSGEGQRVLLFEATCHNLKSSLCKTDEKPRYRSSMVTLDYSYSSEEQTLLFDLKENIPLKYLNLVKAREQEKELQSYIEQINKTIPTKLSVEIEADYLLIDLNEVISDYYSQNLVEAQLKLGNISDIDYTKKLNEFNKNFETYHLNIDLLSKLNDEKFTLAYDYYMKVNKEKATELKTLFDNLKSYDFNTFEGIAGIDDLYFIHSSALNIIRNFEQEKTKTNNEYYKKVLNDYNSLNQSSLILSGDVCKDAVLVYNEIQESSLKVSFDINYCTETFILMEEPLPTHDSIELRYESSYPSLFMLNDPPKECCVFGECSSCEVNPLNYPIIFVHGYSFNNKDPPESSINAFTKIQKELNSDKLFINAGDIDYSSNTEGYWSNINKPVSVRATYYYIPYYETGSIVKSIRKEEGIESYSIRLKELIEYTLAKTGADKVKIVAHSMGGLVTRNYLALFGENKVDKVILIGTPNNGVSGRVEKYCGYLGDKKACNDMAEGSVFMKRLAIYKPTLPIYTIIGKGCDTEGKEGDGIVTHESSYLDFAENIYVEGKCSDFLNTELHSDLVDPYDYPEVYEHIKEIMAE